MKNLKLIIAILTATLLSMAAATSGFGMCTDKDTLNILSSGAIQEKPNLTIMARTPVISVKARSKGH